MPRAEPDPKLARILLHAREDSGLSRERLAVYAGIGSAALQKIETGKSVPSWGTVIALLAALDLSLHELADRLED